MTQKVDLPYFDLLLTQLGNEHSEIELAFGRHVHWGYWRIPEQATHSPEEFGQAAELLTREVYSAAHPANGMSILDVGCGFGGTIASLNEHYAAMNLVGLNIDARQLERARQIVKPQQGNSLCFIEGSADELPFPEASFDIVLAVECIFHFPNRRDFFQEAYRVLKPGGKLVLSDFVPTAWVLPSLWFKSYSGKGFYGNFDFRFTKSSYSELAKRTNFEMFYNRNITANTLPTYKFLWKLKKMMNVSDFSADIETSLLQIASRLGILKYRILAFSK